MDRTDKPDIVVASIGHSSQQSTRTRSAITNRIHHGPAETTGVIVDQDLDPAPDHIASVEINGHGY